MKILPCVKIICVLPSDRILPASMEVFHHSSLGYISSPMNSFNHPYMIRWIYLGRKTGQKKLKAHAQYFSYLKQIRSSNPNSVSEVVIASQKTKILKS